MMYYSARRAPVCTAHFLAWFNKFQKVLITFLFLSSFLFLFLVFFGGFGLRNPVSLRKNKPKHRNTGISVISHSLARQPEASFRAAILGHHTETLPCKGSAHENNTVPPSRLIFHFSCKTYFAFMLSLCDGDNRKEILMLSTCS